MASPGANATTNTHVDHDFNECFRRGYNAFMGGFRQEENPYADEKHRIAWDKGWRTCYLDAFGDRSPRAR